MNDAQINRLYDKFETKDMPRDQFQKEVKKLLDPNTMIKDVRAMAESKGLLKVKN